MASYPEKTLTVSEAGWLYDPSDGTWVKIPPGLYRADPDGWGYNTEVKTPEKLWEWPEANDEPDFYSYNYQHRHPTRYTWRADVEAWARYLVNTYDCWVNTYYDHPEGYDRTYDSFDVWGPAGRNDPLDRSLGAVIWKELFYDQGKPDIDWMIYEGEIWSRATGFWVPFGYDDFTYHFDHIHVTYV